MELELNPSSELKLGVLQKFDKERTKIFFRKGYSIMRKILTQSWIPTIAAALILAGCTARSPQGMPKMTPEVSVVTVQAQRLVLTTDLPGRAVSSRVSEVRPQVSGLILKRTFKEGSYVKEGDLLYQIDPAQYQAAYNQAKASVSIAEANLPALRLRVDRFKALAATHAIGQQDYDDAVAALHLAEAQLESAKAAVQSAQINLSYTPIKAPISGQIGKSNVTEGAMVTAYQAIPLATIQQLDPIYVDVPQSTAEILKLQNHLMDKKYSSNSALQKKVSIIREDGSVYSLEGILEFRDITVNPTTGSVSLRITVPNPKYTLLPGMFIHAVVKEGILEQAILVPQASVSRDQKGDPYAWVVDASGKAQMQMLTIDRAVGNQWLVSSGLTAGDRIIVEGIQRLQPGVAVTVTTATTD
jgi:membrane fusion protein, multidrug efflux system